MPIHPENVAISVKDQARDFLIVGIGASAGGIQALKAFFEQVPASSGLAFVVILHLSPDHDSLLAEILQTSSGIPVTQVKEKGRIRPDHVYVVPPDRHLTMEDGHLVVTKNVLQEDRRAPVDIFFRTLAESHGERAVCVVLSGTGANGSMGLRRIKECGGAAFVQDPKEAEFDEMPRNSILTGMVDEVLPVGLIPGKIMNYKDNLGTVNIPVESELRTDHQQKALQEVLTHLRVNTGHDFSNYKRPTLLRRIERRIYIRNLPDLPAYAAFLQQNPNEVKALLKDLLISVTNFFRDHRAFEKVKEEVLPAIFRDKTAENQVRIWVAGCATGEEAYSIAMLCAERTMKMVDAPKIQIFATDIDDTAIARARDALYSINDAADVSSDRLNNFFIKDGAGYRIRREIRELVMFANHNFIKDPPFSHLDLVCCRNVLIYLNHTAQTRVMETFHFALNPSGFLFLGTSESTDGAGDLYTVFNREQHIFRTREMAFRTSYPVPESIPALKVEPNRQATPPIPRENRLQERINSGELHQRLLEQYAPPSIVINEDFDILHLSEKAGRYLQFSGGEISQNLVQLVKNELRLELQAALYQAVRLKAPVETRLLQVSVDHLQESIKIILKPVFGEAAAKGYILVLFEKSDGEIKEGDAIHISDEPITRHLEDELARLRTQLLTSNDQHGQHAEQLNASNEELQAMNEELRSAAEELETSKEELQSINEELRTVNQEMKIKIEEIGLSNNNLQNLIRSTEVGTIFLDRSLRISLFTPSARDIFNLIPADNGRPLSDITNRLEYKHLLEDAGEVLQKLTILQREVATTDGRIFMMRVLPYRTVEDKINGVVLTFFDISDRKRIEETKLFLASIVESSEDSIVAVNFEGIITSWNLAAEKLYGCPAAGAIGKPITTVKISDELKAVMANIDKIKQSQRVETFNTTLVTSDERLMNLEIVLSPIRDKEDNVVGVSTIARDVTERKLAEERLFQIRESLEIALDAAGMSTWSFDFTTERIVTDTRFYRLFGYKEPVEHWSMESLLQHILPADREKYDIVFNNAPENGILDLQFRVRWPDGSIHWLYQVGRVSSDQSGQPLYLTGITLDITGRKQTEEAIQISEERNRMALQSAGMAAWDWNMDENKVSWNDQHFFVLGIGHALEDRPPGFFLQFIHPEDMAGVRAAFEKTMREGDIFHSEFRIIRADDREIRWVEGFGRVIVRETSTARHMIGVLYDITHSKRLQEQKDEFISIASHELKTPVTSIKAYAQLLERMSGKGKESEKDQLLEKLIGQIDRLGNLIHTLLDSTKVFEGQLPLHLSEFILNDLILERIDDLKVLSEHHRIIFKPTASFPVHADRVRIGEVLTNLITNAIKYSPMGGDVSIDCATVDDGTKVTVTDQGIGISEELHKKVFARFFRGNDSMNQVVHGLGLGLYIAAGIIYRHHGTIGVDSKLGKGSTFYFVLPNDPERID